MFKPLTFGLLLAACGPLRADPAAPLEFKLSARRDQYVVGRPGPPARGQAPAVVLEAELRNTGSVSLQVIGPPEPELSLTGPKADSVRKAGGRWFYAPQTAAFTLAPGDVMRVPVRSLSYRVGTEQWSLHWREPGDYRLTAVWSLTAIPVVAGAPRVAPAAPAVKGAAVTVTAVPLTLHVRAGDETVYWAEALSDPAGEVRLVAALALKARHRDAFSARKQLAAALADAGALVRQTAAEALRQLGPAAESEAPALRRALADPDAAVRVAAAAALAQVAPKDPASGRAVLPLLQDRSAAVRQAGAEALGYMAVGGLPPDAATVAALRAALKGGDLATRDRAVWALGHVRHPDSVLDLIGLLRPEHRALRHQVLHAIGNLGPVAAAAVPELVEVLRGDPENREMAAWTLACIRSQAAPAVPALMECLEDKRPSVRNQAARALRDIGPASAEAVDALAGALVADGDGGVRQYAAEALGAIGPGAAGAAEFLGRALGDPMVQVRNAAATALGAIGPKARAGLPSLVGTLLGDADGQARWLAAQSIGQIGVADESTVGALVKALADRDAPVVAASAIALGRLGPGAGGAVPALTKLAGADGGDPFLRRSAREALEKIRPK